MVETVLSHLPTALQPWKSRIATTIQPYVRVTATFDATMTVWQSKFGGMPYLPKDVPYPHCVDGQPMSLLAQINFADVPPVPSFPAAGIIQFYIASAQSLYGMNDLDLTDQANFRVLFHADVLYDVTQLITHFDFLPSSTELPITTSCSLRFQRDYAPMSVGDYRFEETFADMQHSVTEAEWDDLIDLYALTFRSDGHKLGGYPTFTQIDPRYYEPYRQQGFELLLQMDTDGSADIMWGDAGVGNFFIRMEDLSQRNFTTILYNWDCA